MSLFSWFLSSKRSDWCEKIRDPLSEIEAFYKTRTDIPRNIRYTVAKRRLNKVDGISPYVAKTVLKQWDTSLQASPAPRAQSCIDARERGPTMPNTLQSTSEQSTPKHSLSRQSISEPSDTIPAHISSQAIVPSPLDDNRLQPNKLLLGESLVLAGLINAHHVEVALRDACDRSDLKFGEILALRGWIDQETADFFADTLHYIAAEVERQPIGQYFKAAKLLTEEQISKVLATQRDCSIRFGELAVAHHYLKQQTLDFMLPYLV